MVMMVLEVMVLLSAPPCPHSASSEGQPNSQTTPYIDRKLTGLPSLAKHSDEVKSIMREISEMLYSENSQTNMKQITNEFSMVQTIICNPHLQALFVRPLANVYGEHWRTCDRTPPCEPAKGRRASNQNCVDFRNRQFPLTKWHLLHFQTLGTASD